MKEINDIGIYTNIHESGNKTKDGIAKFYATCKICGITVEKKLSNIYRSNKICRHTKASKKINDMPTGWINQSTLNKRIYDLWKDMIYRTTQKCWDKYPTYEGTTVDESWLVLSNFIKDIQELNGYDAWLNASKRTMMLDKDTLVDGNKHYSKDTCCFITSLESSIDVNRRHPNNVENAKIAAIEHNSIPIKLINKKTKEEKFFPSLKEACRQMNFNERNAWKVLSDKYPTCHSIDGWIIQYNFE